MTARDIVHEMQEEGARQRRNAAALRKAQPREPKTKARLARPERDLQRSIVVLARRAFPQVLLAAIPNEQAGASGDANARARFGAARKASGVLSGFPDLVACLPGGGILFLELKSDKGTLSAAQHLVHARLVALGHQVRVIRTLDQAAEALRAAMQRPGP